MRDVTYFRQKISSILNFREKTHNVSWFDSHKREKMFGKTKKLHFFINSNYSSIQYISWNDPVMFTWRKLPVLVGIDGKIYSRSPYNHCVLAGATMQCPSVICTVGDINGPTSIIPHYTDCLNFSTHTAVHISCAVCIIWTRFTLLYFPLDILRFGVKN